MLIEPDSVFIERHAYAPEDAFAFTAADPHVINLLRAGPMPRWQGSNVALDVVGGIVGNYG